MPRGGSQTIGQVFKSRFNRRTTILMASSCVLVVLLVSAGCRGVHDSGTDFNTLATMEARRTAPPPAVGSPQADPDPTDVSQLQAAGQQIWSTQGCQGCHTLDGSAAVGPTWAGLWMAEIPLADGRTVTADEAYIQRAIWEPNAEIHQGFQPIMPSYQGVLDENQVRAVIEFIKTLE
jgi:mono/diheme cytochrome c family protein